MSKFGKYAPNVFLAVFLDVVTFALVVMLVIPSVLPPDGGPPNEYVMERADSFAHILTEAQTEMERTW